MNKPLLEPATGRIETADDYGRVVARLNPRWRIIVGSCGIQWILQRRNPTESQHKAIWRGRSYCRTPEALIRCVREHAGTIAPAVAAILAALPERIETVAGETGPIDEEAGI